MRKELNNAQRELVDAIDDAIEQSRREYRGLRAVGFAVALAGSLLLSAANLV